MQLSKKWGIFLVLSIFILPSVLAIEPPDFSNMNFRDFLDPSTSEFGLMIHFLLIWILLAGTLRILLGRVFGSGHGILSGHGNEENPAIKPIYLSASALMTIGLYMFEQQFNFDQTLVGIVTLGVIAILLGVIFSPVFKSRKEGDKKESNFTLGKILLILLVIFFILKYFFPNMLTYLPFLGDGLITAIIVIIIGIAILYLLGKHVKPTTPSSGGGGGGGSGSGGGRTPPGPTVKVVVCDRSDLLPGPNCRSTHRVEYPVGSQPTQTCTRCQPPGLVITGIVIRDSIRGTNWRNRFPVGARLIATPIIEDNGYPKANVRYEWNIIDTETNNIIPSQTGGPHGGHLETQTIETNLTALPRPRTSTTKTIRFIITRLTEMPSGRELINHPVITECTILYDAAITGATPTITLIDAYNNSPQDHNRPSIIEDTSDRIITRITDYAPTNPPIFRWQVIETDDHGRDRGTPTEYIGNSPALVYNALYATMHMGIVYKLTCTVMENRNSILTRVGLGPKPVMINNGTAQVPLENFIFISRTRTRGGEPALDLQVGGNRYENHNHPFEIDTNATAGRIEANPRNAPPAAQYKWNYQELDASGRLTGTQREFTGIRTDNLEFTIIARTLHENTTFQINCAMMERTRAVTNSTGDVTDKIIVRVVDLNPPTLEVRRNDTGTLTHPQGTRASRNFTLATTIVGNARNLPTGSPVEYAWFAQEIDPVTGAEGISLPIGSSRTLTSIDHARLNTILPKDGIYNIYCGLGYNGTWIENRATGQPVMDHVTITFTKTTPPITTTIIVEKEEGTTRTSDKWPSHPPFSIAAKLIATATGLPGAGVQYAWFASQVDLTTGRELRTARIPITYGLTTNEVDYTTLNTVLPSSGVYNIYCVLGQQVGSRIEWLKDSGKNTISNWVAIEFTKTATTPTPTPSGAVPASLVPLANQIKTLVLEQETILNDINPLITAHNTAAISTKVNEFITKEKELQRKLWDLENQIPTIGNSITEAGIKEIIKQICKVKERGKINKIGVENLDYSRFKIPNYVKWIEDNTNLGNWSKARDTLQQILLGNGGVGYFKHRKTESNKL